MVRTLIVVITAIIIATLWSNWAHAQQIDFTNPPAADWPALKKVYHYGDITICTSKLGITAIACATPDFPNSICDMYFMSRPHRFVVLHEEAHCDGYDHYGDSIMHDNWNRYKMDLFNSQPN